MPWRQLQPLWLASVFSLLMVISSTGAFVGVNLGGWLLMEDWIFPEYFQDVKPPDEHALIHKMGGNTNPTVVAFMKKHWDTFLTETDLDRLASFGVTHLRIPLGYWLVDWQQEDGFVDGGLYYLRRSLQWMQKRSMKVVLDLHALPGAQTPHQSFTACAACYGEADAKQFWKMPYLGRGKEAMRKLALLIQKFEQEEDTRGVVVGMELVNEPDAHKWSQLQALYSEMVPKLRNLLPAANYSLYLSFMNDPEVSGTWMKQKVASDPGNWANVIYDRHLYHAFLDDDTPLGPRKSSWSAQSTDACKTCCRDPDVFTPLNGLPVVVGEWSLTVDTYDAWEFKDAKFLHAFWKDQLSLWANIAIGSFFFTFKLGSHAHIADYFLNFDLLKLVSSAELPHPDDVDISGICPSRQLQDCPKLTPNMDWDVSCAAFDVPKGAGVRNTAEEDEALKDFSSPIPLIAFLIFGGALYASLMAYAWAKERRRNTELQGRLDMAQPVYGTLGR